MQTESQMQYAAKWIAMYSDATFIKSLSKAEMTPSDVQVEVLRLTERSSSDERLLYGPLHGILHFVLPVISSLGSFLVWDPMTTSHTCASEQD